MQRRQGLINGVAGIWCPALEGTPWPSSWARRLRADVSQADNRPGRRVDEAPSTIFQIIWLQSLKSLRSTTRCLANARICRTPTQLLQRDLLGTAVALFCIYSAGYSTSLTDLCPCGEKASGSCYLQGQCEPKGRPCCGWEGASPPVAAVASSYTKFKLNFTYTTSVCICYPRFRCRRAVTLKLYFFAFLLKCITKMWRMDVLACHGNLVLGIHGFSFLPFEF